MHSPNLQKNKTMNIWLLTDDKTGHFNQIKGLTEALASYRKIKITRPSLLPSSKALMMLLGLCNKKSKLELPDIIVGAGHKTHLSLLAYKRCYGGNSVVVMSPSLPKSFFDLCLIPRHDNPTEKSNIIETLGAINRIHPELSTIKKDTGLILLGGTSKHFKWDTMKVIKQIKNLLAIEKGTQWVLAGSRRTPQSTYDELKSHVPKLPIIFPDNVSKDWLPKKILQSEQIWISADSISMVYESLTSGSKTGILKLDYDKPSRITREIDKLLSDNIISSLEFTKQATLPYPIYEADRCAKLLLEKFDL